MYTEQDLIDLAVYILSNILDDSEDLTPLALRLVESFVNDTKDE